MSTDSAASGGPLRPAGRSARPLDDADYDAVRAVFNGIIATAGPWPSLAVEAPRTWRAGSSPPGNTTLHCRCAAAGTATPGATAASCWTYLLKDL